MSCCGIQWQSTGWVSGGGGGAVDSVFTRTGAVVAAIGDYTSEQITDPTFGDVKIMGEQLDALALTVAGKVDAGGGTLTNGTIAGTVSTSVTGTLTAAALSIIDLDGAGSVAVPTVSYPNNTTAAASTAFVTSGLATKVNASGGTLSSGTLNGGTTLDGTLTASATALIDLDAAGAEVRVPTVVASDSSTKAASTAFVQAALRDDVQLAFGGVNERDDFISSTTTSGDLPWSTSANGGASSIGPANAVSTGAYGYRSFTAGTAATGRAAYTRSELVSTQAAFVTPWLAGTITLAWRIQLPTLPVIASDFPVYSFSLGTGLAVASDHFVNGIGLRYAVNTSTNWFLASRSAGADVVAAANTGIGPTAGAWQVLVLVISGASASCYIGSTYAAALAAGVRATISTAGAYASMISPLMKVNNTAATATARPILVDTYALDFTLTTPR